MFPTHAPIRELSGTIGREDKSIADIFFQLSDVMVSPLMSGI